MKKTGKLIGIMLVITMFIAFFIGVFNSITFADNDPGVDDQTPKYNVNFGKAEWNVNGVKVTAAVWGMEINTEQPIEIADNEDIKLDNFNSDTMQIVVRAEDGFNTTLAIEGDRTQLRKRPESVNLPNATLTFSVEAKPNENPNSPEVPGNPNSPENPGNPNSPEHADGGEEDIEFDVKFTGTHMNMWINNITVMSDEKEFMDEFKGTIRNAGTTNPNETNILRFIAPFGDKEVSEYIINGKKYTKENAIDDRDNNLYFEVPGAAKYTVTGEADENSQANRTIIWANPGYVAKDAADEEWIKEFKLEHGAAYIKAVYAEDGHLVDPEEYLSQNWSKDEIDRGVGKDKFGWVTIIPGNKVIFEFVPEYGYQLTGIQINGFPIDAGNAINEFEFNMPDTNIHFDAEFSKTKDIIKTESNKVIEGELSLGKNALDSGTAQLTVKDINLDENKIKEFEDAAKEYKIKNYLDIDLYQVFYKGKKDDTDVWSNKIDELEEEGKITLKLQDGISAEDVVIIHNIHNGDKYEIIEIESYDKEANTITFRTKSFSNYAIATKNSSKANKIKLEDKKTKAIIEFEDKDGHEVEEFEFTIIDITKLSEEEMKAFEMTKEQFDAAMKKIKDSCKKEGTFIKLFNIEVRIPGEDRGISEGPFTIKIPYTDDLKEYNVFKLAYINEENFTVEETIELKLEGDYLVGTLKHLSPYALIGRVEENEETSKSGSDTLSNPTTGDLIAVYVSIFVLSAVAITTELIHIKKRNK